MKPKISAAVMVYNGVHTLAQCVESLRFCDEIVVVDDCSTDGTWELIQTLGVKGHQHRHTTFAAQRGLARDLCTGEWVLTMDADEYVTPTLRNGILQAVQEKNVEGYFIQRKNPYPKGLKGHGFTWHPRLVRKNVCKWVDTDSPHSPLDMRGVKMRRLKHGVLDHEPLPDVPTALRKAINRNAIICEQMRARGKRGSVWRMCAGVVGRWVKMWLFKGGWKHGRDGFLFASLDAYEAYVRYVLLMTGGVSARGPGEGTTEGSYPVGAPWVSVPKGEQRS
jgi:glycosyltransferase involved in cell wall biosynthesis